MKINDFRGDLTDVSAKKEALLRMCFALLDFHKLEIQCIGHCSGNDRRCVSVFYGPLRWRFDISAIFQGTYSSDLSRHICKYLTAANCRPESSTPDPCTDVDRAIQISAQVTCTMHFIVRCTSVKDDY